ncbi:MAG: hypothetical protein ACREMY_03030 [bacterium]
MIGIGQRLKSEHGVAALLTAVFVAVFLSILTISISDVLNTEQHQTLDIHNSDRAEAAAKAGVEDALARIKYWSGNSGCIYTESNSTPQTCAAAVKISQDSCPDNGSDSVWQFTENAGSACWIHRSVKSLTNNLSGSLVADTGNYTQASTAQINLGGQTKAIVVNWGDPNTNPITSCNLSQNPWPNNVAGALELTRISYDNSGNIDNPVKGLLMPKVTLGVPCDPTGTGGNPYGNLGTFSNCPNQYNQSTGANPKYKFCSQITIPAATTNNFPNAYLRLRARFAGDTYSIVALTATNGAQATLPNNSLTIDVTGQSGNVFRRVIAQSTITNPQIYSIFDFVLFTQNDLNKSYACVNAAPNATCQ